MPADLAAAVAAQGQVLAWASHPAGFIAVTKSAIMDISNDVKTVTPWSESLQAKWEPPNLTVVFQGKFEVEPTSRSWILDEGSQLPRAVRDRVTSAVVIDRVFELPSAGRVRFVARKDKTSVFWSAIADDLAASQTEIGQMEIAKATIELRSTFGI